MQAVDARIREVRDSLGTEPLTRYTAGLVAQRLIEIDVRMRNGAVEDARQALAALLRTLTGDTES